MPLVGAKVRMLAKFLRSLGRKSAPATYEHGFALAHAAYECGDLMDAEAGFVNLVAARPELPEAWLYAGTCAFRQNNVPLALARFVTARELDPDNPEYSYQESVALAALGSIDAARIAAARACELAPNVSPAHHFWAALELPGDDYMAFMRRLHPFLKPATYLEIGVFRGMSLALVDPGTEAIGVDPAPQIAHPLSPNIAVEVMTSDDFFASRDAGARFGGRPLALGFIDGMHRFEFALRDFINMERLCAGDATILIHDCYPLNRATAGRDVRAGMFWSGDIWRLILIFKKYRPDLQVNTLALAPTGLGVVRSLDPASTVLVDRYDEIVAEFLAIDYDVLAADKPGMLNLFPNRWEAIVKLFV